jgi:hypothetical protein
MAYGSRPAAGPRAGGMCTKFWAKAQLGFGRADDCDASSATFLLGGVVDEPLLPAGGV